MTQRVESMQLCQFCGYAHAPDYSDVRGTVQEWIEGVCIGAKAEARRTKQPEKAVAVTARTPDGREHSWMTRETGEHVPMPLVLHVKFKRIHGFAGTPAQAYRGDAGYDLELCENATLQPGQWANLHTGLVVAIPDGYWGHILARSSTWRHLGIRVEPAVIDSSYRGELMVYAVSTRKEPQEVKVGQRLAQIIIIPLPNVEWLEQRDVPPGERGERGYGSSGGQG